MEEKKSQAQSQPWLLSLVSYRTQDHLKCPTRVRRSHDTQTNSLRSLLEDGVAHRPEKTCTERETEKMVRPAFKDPLAHAHRGKMWLHQTLMTGLTPCTCAQEVCMSESDADDADGGRPTRAHKGFSWVTCEGNHSWAHMGHAGSLFPRVRPHMPAFRTQKYSLMGGWIFTPPAQRWLHPQGVGPSHTNH